MAIDWVVADAQRVITGKFGIRYDTWFKQSKFIDDGYLDKTIDALRKRGVIVERDGVIFFETPEAAALRRDQTDEGWVLVDKAGDPKYLATDIAYHRLCLEERGVDLKLNVWGANTQYHLQQMKIAMPALGIDPSRLEVVLYQYVRFLKEGVLTRMGRRTGEYLLLEDVLDAVGADVTRFFLLQRSADSPLDFDFELAVQQSNDNPVYYVQYAHARIASIFRTAAERGITPDGADLQLLTAPGEREMIRLVQKFPELLSEIEEHRGVHLLPRRRRGQRPALEGASASRAGNPGHAAPDTASHGSQRAPVDVTSTARMVARALGRATLSGPSDTGRCRPGGTRGGSSASLRDGPRPSARAA